ncbi:MAG: thiol:disulfide interchange protein [Gallionellaceae bacterium CG1_02_56_997]|nr:MAG: thiol:disulfide interchange protein [Gallionellaceae bacterium CG1_02_56_997]PIV14627.1 MAG: DsbE family thiol:disulfide interchange protein [Gallionellales bacterium CG03_land_8_20_14_0_80_55_15]PIV91317.1 MAG: DsbE family thiol:disulfide interchange protein [Gallionellales bacterium CG17_big_fil_post_rev_8_21_14_2_50_54_146]PIX04185.1 MAG: DsbE family thiol:disulfide interchange protein [Gallionellales bacterium CG_4_8_14_3_um_filter_54_18]PJC05072.1 MAG: DsbE family thiol:disulfide i
MMRFILPLVIFLILSVFLYKGLGRDTREVPSPLVGKAAPAFVLPQLYEPTKKFSPQEMLGKVWLMNVWASWCGACKDEHPLLLELSRQNIVPIVGLDYKDKAEDGQMTLNKAGNPYTLVIADADGKVGFDYGVYGVPETYLIDKKGMIAFKLIGAVTPENLREKILPRVAELQAK